MDEAPNLFEKALLNQSVFVNKNAINPHFIPQELPFRERQINEVTMILASALHNQKPSNLFVYGKVGTGKTATIRHVITHLMAFKEKNQAKVGVTYVNCRTHNSKYKVLQKCLKEFYPEQNFLGYSAAYVYEKLLDYPQQNGHHLILILDELDKVKDLDELVYSLTRSNDELGQGSITLIGISNNVLFKDRLDARTKSALCEKEMVFPPYNAEELKEILKQRVQLAFLPGKLQESAINLAAAFAGKESGDARTAVLLLLRAGEICDSEKKNLVTEEHIHAAKKMVEHEVVLNMITTLPEQERLVLYAIACLTEKRRPMPTLSGVMEEGIIMSGDAYEEYLRCAKKIGEQAVSQRWFRAYLNELEVYGMIGTTKSGPGLVGNTRLIRLNYEFEKVKSNVEKDWAE